jgi:hypothetical protein
MRTKKKTQKPALVAFLNAQAVRLIGGPTEGQRRMFRVAAGRNKELEPSGLMAGSSARA